MGSPNGYYERGATIGRLVELILRVSRGEALPVVSRLAKEYGVSERTIRRYLLEIERHVPVLRQQREYV